MFAGIRGKYTKKIDASECKECSAGYYSDVVGPPETPYCKSCPRGKVGRLTGATTEASTCDNCVAGRFSDVSGRAMASPANIETDCFECAKGRYNTEIGSDSEVKCIGCNVGKYSEALAAVSSSVCKPCNSGKYSIIVGAKNDDTCVKCPKGKNQPDSGQAFCLGCIPGRYMNEDGKETCKLCQVGKFAGNMSRISCESCPDGRDSKTGMSSCSTCKTGRFQFSYLRENANKYYERSSGRCTDDDGGYIETEKECEEGASVFGWFDATISVTTVSQSNIPPSCYYTSTGIYFNTDTSSTILCNPNYKCLCLLPVGDAYVCKDCEAGKVALAGDAGCSECVVGRYQDSIGKGTCKACGAGTWNNNTGAKVQTACQKCGAGKYSTATGAISEDICNDCSPGKASTTIGASSSSTCILCEPGLASAAPASQSCNDCKKGTYNSAKGKALCLDCVPGMYENEHGSLGCSECPVGKSAPKTQSSNCSNCSVGQHQMKIGATLCFDCIPGKFKSTKGAILCDNCKIDTFTANSSRSSCSTCPHGRNAAVGSAKCSTCSTGRKKISNGIDDEYTCNACEPGKIAQAGADICDSCVAGLFQPETGQGTCKACRAGKWNNNTGAKLETSCTHCDPGYYSTAQGSSSPASCNECPPGKASQLFGANHSSACKKCDPGQASDAGSVVCSSCSIGQYQNSHGSASCLSCVPGQYQNKTGTEKCLACKTAQFANSSGFVTCLKCRPGFQSLNPGAVECQRCAAGRATNNSASQCDQCKPGSYRTEKANEGKYCDPCKPGEETLLPGSVKCSRCGAGYYNDEEGATCQKCLEGTFRTATANDGLTCKQCPIGYFQNQQGEASCLPCVPGKYQHLSGRHVCNKCPVGTFSQLINSTKCTIPKIGFVAGPSNAGSLKIATGWVATDCTTEGTNKICRSSAPCPAGTFSNPHVCQKCNIGFSSTRGIAKCHECEKGKFSSEKGTLCENCGNDENTFSDTEGSTKCKICPSGYKTATSFCIEASTDTTLPLPENIRVTNIVDSESIANISWVTVKDVIDSDSRVKSLEIQWSKTSKFSVGEDTKFLLVPAPKLGTGSHIINLGNNGTNYFQALWKQVLYVRLRTISEELRHSVWSSIALPWRVAGDCSKQQFLNTIFDGATFDHPLSWTCNACPEGSFCEGDIMYRDVVPMFGNWRVPGEKEGVLAPHVFVECPFSAACLGAPNPILAHKYLNGSGGVDFALTRLPESCNHLFGFKPGSRLCHGCLSTFRRMGRDRCAQCPEEDSNVGLLVIAVFLLLLAGTIVVWMAIADAGKATISEISRKIMFNYLQISALAAGFPMKWPPALEALFDFQGAISTAGEHLLNPDCSARGLNAADLFYYKQYGYAAIPPGLALIIYLYWRCYACVRKLEWRGRPTANSHNSKDKMVVTLCVLLYFFWPTLLGQAFRLFSCRSVGNDPALYLLADFEEPCFVGRHLYMAIIMGGGQILLYALGLPIVVFFFLHRHKHELDKPVVKFRYGLFFAGFRHERYYWECIVALRKESIVVLAVFGPSMGTSQLAHVALIVILFQVLVQLVGSPYQTTVHARRLQVLDVASLLVCWVTMWSGYFFHSVEFASRGESLEILTIGVIVINVLHMSILIYNMLHEMCLEKKDTELMKKISKRISIENAPQIIRLRVQKARRQRQAKDKKTAKRTFSNPSRKSEIPHHLQSKLANIEMTKIELETKNKSKTMTSNEFRVEMKKKARHNKKRTETEKKRKKTASQRVRRQTINRIALQKSKLKLSLGASNPLYKDIVVNVKTEVETLTDGNGRRYTFNNSTDEAIWLDEEIVDKIQTEETEEIETLTDENGRRYTWNHQTEEATWLDEEIVDETQTEETEWLEVYPEEDETIDETTWIDAEN